MSQSQQKNIWKSFLGPLAGSDQNEVEKSRLEAFLSAFPGEYCGFSSQGSVVYSDKFAKMLDLDRIESINDVQNRLSASDAAALEGMFIRLHDESKPFSINVQSLDKEHYYRLSGTKGEALNGNETFSILWLEDITEYHGKIANIERKRDFADSELKKFQNILNSISLPLWMRNAQNRYCMVQ